MWDVSADVGGEEILVVLGAGDGGHFGMAVRLWHLAMSVARAWLNGVPARMVSTGAGVRRAEAGGGVLMRYPVGRM